MPVAEVEMPTQQDAPEHEMLVDVRTSFPLRQQLTTMNARQKQFCVGATVSGVLLCLVLMLFVAGLANQSDPDLKHSGTTQHHAEATELWWGNPTVPAAATFGEAETAANEEYLRPYLAGLALVRESSVGQDIIDLAGLVDILPTAANNLAVGHFLPSSELTVPINTIVPLRIQKWGWVDIPLPASYEIVSVTFSNLNQFTEGVRVSLLDGGNFTWSLKMATAQTSVFVIARIELLGHSIYANVSLTVKDPAVQMAAIVALNTSKICQVWGTTMESSTACKTWPIMIKDGISGLNITLMDIQISDFNSNVSLSGVPLGYDDTLRTKLLDAINDEKPSILASIPNISKALPSKATSAALSSLPNKQAQCAAANRFTTWKPPCICDSQHPHCYLEEGSDDNGFCYGSAHSYSYSETTCPGQCTESFDSSAVMQLGRARTYVQPNGTLNVDRICVSNGADISLEWSYQDCLACQPGAATTLPADSSASDTFMQGQFRCMNIQTLEIPGCSCSVKHPYCNNNDHYCYQSKDSSFWNSGFSDLTRSTCPGTCTRNYDPEAPLPVLKDGDAVRVKIHANNGARKLAEPAMRFVNGSNTVAFECTSDRRSGAERQLAGASTDYSCEVVSVVPTDADLWPSVSQVCMINHADFAIRFDAQDGRTGETSESATFASNQRECIALGAVTGVQDGDEFIMTAHSADGGTWSDVYQSNQPALYSDNGLTVTYECQGTTSDYTCTVLR